ncbi:MAG TPA: magnesium chelatase ATPase subunit D [Chloroflexia bacterium]|nr:magnesium chelatase ATPase subunit D [Chloroflexia bacterium]
MTLSLEKLELIPQHMPFAAVVGHSLAKQAMLLLAIEPRLGGITLAARPGTAKTTLARSFHALLPSVTAIKHCPSHCDPERPVDWCSDCRRDYYYKAKKPAICCVRPAFINLPLNITEDRLLGGLALEATLRLGRRVAERGVLAEANQGVLYCDEMNLLDDGLGNYLMDTLSRGRLALEREGLSAEYPAHFILIGTFDPDEGEIRAGLLDRVGLVTSASTLEAPESRMEVMRRSLAWDRAPASLEDEFQDETHLLRSLVEAGRELLPRVVISNDQRLALSEVGLRLGVPGNRAELFAVRAALASAALQGRPEVDDSDLKLAVQLVLLPRATRLPDPEPPEEEEPPPPPEQPPEQPETDENEPPSQQEQQPELEDLVLSALAAELPEDILALVQARQTRAKSGSRGEALNWKRGRHVRSVSGKPGQGRIAIIDTLRTAAPFQSIRQAENGTGQKAGSVSGSAAPSKNGAAPYKIELRADDLRFKRYKDKAGVLFIFAVDASGSMALNRMREAKGAVTQLLQQAYVHRDKVALISFRGREAEILLPPSQSVELAKRSLDVLPTGGGTPLASALLTSRKLNEQARQQGISKTMVVLITDGRGNVLLREDEETAGLSKEVRKARAVEEITLLAEGLAAEGLSAVVLDTQTNFLSKGEAAELSRHLRARYIYLPRADSRAIAYNVVTAAEQLR